MTTQQCTILQSSPPDSLAQVEHAWLELPAQDGSQVSLKIPPPNKTHGEKKAWPMAKIVIPAFLNSEGWSFTCDLDKFMGWNLTPVFGFPVSVPRFYF